MDISLTPAELRESEAVFPGENWFCYWRTSASLWESKLQQITTQGAPLFVPLYWGFHSENGEVFDFGQQKPEADLARLCKVIENSGHEAIWLLPMTPAPLQPNGGLPALIARNPSQDQHGMTQAYLDSDGGVHKMHSFYDPRVYQAYRKWTWNLGKFLSDQNISVPIKGLRSFWVDSQTAHSYLEDYSPTFVAGFVRFLKSNKMSTRINDDGIEVPAISSSDSRVQMSRYRKLIADLYSQTAAESLANYWSGDQDYGFLGGAPQDIFARSSDIWPHHLELMQDVWTQMDWNLLPSSVLVAHKNKKGPLARFLKDYLTPSFVRSTLQHHISSESESGHFTPLVFFDIFWDDDFALEASENLNDLGLLPHMKREYRGCWRWRGRFDFQRELEEDSTQRLKFFFGHQMDKSRFQQMLKLFMNGHKIVLDRSGLEPLFEKKLQLFITENELAVQDINFLTKITMIRLGDGMLMLHDGNQLKEQQATKKQTFWDHVTKYLQVRHLTVNGDEPMFFTWRTRATNSFELNYDEVRRLSIYNPTIERLRFQVPSSKQFAFLKLVDPEKAQIKSSPMGIEIEVMAGGSVSLDFGHFEG